ncbi:MAG: prealbumin-like fold domain-containing protein, partial [Coriobacteriales bacterium]|nr:prealbumin-like fold domain-containing protein [Coriobacteriales bacterium]
MIATITVKNKSTSFQVKKMDSSTSSPLEGAHFALYYAVEDSVTHEKIKDYNPIPGYEDLVTDANGILHDVNAGLQARTYFLTELQAPDGYDLFPEGHRDLMFTIGEDGTVSIDTEEYKDWLKVSPGAEPGE